jgi:hypothetical protein
MYLAQQGGYQGRLEDPKLLVLLDLLVLVLLVLLVLLV